MGGKLITDDRKGLCCTPKSSVFVIKVCQRNGDIYESNDFGFSKVYCLRLRLVTLCGTIKHIFEEILCVALQVR